MLTILHDLHIEIRNPWIVGFINAGLVAAVFAALFIFGKNIVLNSLRKAIHVFQATADESLIYALFKLLKRLGLLVGLDLIVEGLPLTERIAQLITSIIFVVTTLLVVIGLFDLTNVVAKFFRSKAPEFEPLITKTAKILTVTFAVMVVMRHFNYDIWHIMTALGVGSLAVGLAAQPTLSNMIAGFTILIDRPFRPGDRVSLAGGDTGDVKHIGMRSTHIQTTDGNMLIVSNSELVNSRVINFSMPNTHLGHKVRFFFDQQEDLKALKIVIGDSVRTVPGVVKESVNVLATNVTDWSLEVGAFFQVENFTQTALITDKVIDAVISGLKEKQIKLATSPHLSPKF